METRKIVLGVAVLLIAVAIIYLNNIGAPADGGVIELSVTDASPRVQEKEQRYEKAKELAGISGYLNTANITIGEHIGKNVVLLDFWTYTCINCQRTLPYLIAWDEKYRDDGLVIIGIHTPEFEFEKKKENVQNAIEEFGIKYPVVQDNDYATWRAYGNRYWPRKYLIDIDGYIVYDHIGEGNYEETERQIQQALKERIEVLGKTGEIGDSLADVEAYTVNSQSPETYFGSLRNSNFGNGDGTGEQQLEIPPSIKPNTLYLGGRWDIQPEFAENKEEGSIVFHYDAQNVYLVMRADEETAVHVLIDGKQVSSDLAGKDVVDGIVSVKEDRLYKLIESPTYGEHVLELAVEKQGLQAFAFTFG
ncbi:redoxin family protein [Candidatus Woesearchaeota archaeon]|nr:redoxin family protein [Candidatus Woesearchaeota archaeon]